MRKTISVVGSSYPVFGFAAIVRSMQLVLVKREN